MKKIVVVVALLLIASGLGGWWWQNRTPPVQAVQEPPVAPAPAPEPEPVAVAPAEPVIQHPLAVDPAAPVDAASLAQALTDWLGSKSVTNFLQVDDFARRAVATVDNLGREHAASRLWPVNPITGKFSVDTRDGESFIAAANAARYQAFVGFVESVDSERAVGFYRRSYPLFQQAYRELGYPKGYFNDRLIEVIDLLLASPEPTEPPKVQLTEVKGPIESSRPWVRYEYADPALQSLAAGQKIMVRVGHADELRLKAKLRDLRARLVAAEAAR